ncbi:MAG TPA: alpha/beta hydrolase [Candidatus Saccharimonadales bacterium]|jgi:hypothetical protein
MSQTVAILPGIFSGLRTTRRLRKLLRRAGYQIITDTMMADIILAHSAGPLWLPQTSDHQTIVLVNPPYWPGRTIRERARDRLHSNLRFYERGVPLRYWLARQFWGTYYVLRNPRRTHYVLRNMSTYDLQATLKSGKVVLVRSQLDDWLTPDLDGLKRAYPKLIVIELPGDHDDFNYHPEHYVELLQSLI